MCSPPWHGLGSLRLRCSDVAARHTLGVDLQIPVQRGVDSQAVLPDVVRVLGRVVLLLQLVEHVKREVRRIRRHFEAFGCRFAHVLPEGARQTLLAASASAWVKPTSALTSALARARWRAGRRWRPAADRSRSADPLSTRSLSRRGVEIALRLVRLFLRQVAGLDHGRQHLALATIGIGRRPDRVEGRVLRDGRQDGDLVQGEVGGRFVVVDTRRGLDPIGQVAVDVIVEVPLEDLVLAALPG